MWDVLARPVKARPEPPLDRLARRAAPAPSSARSTSTSRRCSPCPPGSVVKVRLIEGFSGEEGFLDMFGTDRVRRPVAATARSTVKPDNSFAAKVPANVPFHIQLVDKFAHERSPTSRSGSAAAPASSASAAAATRTARTTPAIAPGHHRGGAAGRRQPGRPRARQRISSDVTRYGKRPRRPLGQGHPADPRRQVRQLPRRRRHKRRQPAATRSRTRRRAPSQTFTFDLRGQQARRHGRRADDAATSPRRTSRSWAWARSWRATTVTITGAGAQYAGRAGLGQGQRASSRG